MSKSYEKLISANKEWADSIKAKNPEYFKKHAEGQSPEFLWIGCADSRVPANEITGTETGDIFVHRNVANLVVHTDLNFLSVLQYAVEVLKVKHIIVCGHYGCGGVQTALSNTDNGLVNNWLRNIQDVYQKHEAELSAISDQTEKTNRLVELNAIQQATNLAETSIVQNAWKERDLEVHAWVYGLDSGELKELGVTLKSPDDLQSVYKYK